MTRDDDARDPDRAAILARRQRFIALALTGLSTAACKHGEPTTCLKMAVPEDTQSQSPEDPPIVEDPGTPVDSSDAEPEPELSPEPAPEPCLKVRAR